MDTGGAVGPLDIQCIVNPVENWLARLRVSVLSSSFSILELAHQIMGNDGMLSRDLAKKRKLAVDVAASERADLVSELMRMCKAQKTIMVMTCDMCCFVCMACSRAGVLLCTLSKFKSDSQIQSRLSVYKGTI